jgi:hypothetical protein
MKRLGVVIGVLVFAVGCGREECADNLDNNENGLFDCADVEQCGGDVACAEASSLEIDPVNGQDASFAGVSAAYEIKLSNTGTPGAALVVVMSDQVDTCDSFLTPDAVPDIKASFVIAVDFANTDPAVVFPLVAPADDVIFSGNGVDSIASYNTLLVEGGVIVQQVINDFSADVSIDKNGADGLVSVSGSSEVFCDFADTANLDFDFNGDGIVDCERLLVGSMAISISNATECPGLASFFGL